MTGKQRFEAVMNHERPDKFPLYIPSVANAVASEILGRECVVGTDSMRFHEELSIFQGAAAHREFEERFIEDSVDLARALRVDVLRETWRGQGKASKQVDEHTLLFGDENGRYVVKRYFPEQDSYGVIASGGQPDADELAEDMRASMARPNVLPAREDSLGRVRGARRLFDRLKADELGEIVAAGSFGIPMGDQALLELCVTEPELLREWVWRGSECEVAHMQNLADEGYRWFNGGLDMASNTGTVYSPNAFRAIVLEPLRLFASACAARGTIFCYRTDGNIWQVFDDMFVDAGIQAYGEVDRDAGMTVEKIREVNDNLILLGNTSSAFLLTAAPEQVREDTRRQLAAAKGTNFIPGTSNAIVKGTPAANVFAMIEEIERYGSPR